MKKILQGLGVYIVSLILAGLTAYWAGRLFFSGNRYAAGQFPLTNEAFFILYGILITYPFFVSLGLMALLKRHQAWWTLCALIPIAIFLIAFGQELIVYSLIAAAIGALLGFLLSKFLLRQSNT